MSTTSAGYAVDDPRTALSERPMTTFQFGVIAVLFCLNGLDGFDVLAISFAAPGIVHEWAISPRALGAVISLGLFANAFGSLLLAPFADRIGRRPMIFLSLAAMTAGMLLSTFATGMVTLSVGRFITGIGVGALVPCISALAAEYCNRRYRDFGVIIMAVGFPVGGLVGGQVAALLLQHFDWRSVFVAGAVASAALMLAPLRLVPESIEYLLVRRPARVLERVNAILQRLHHPRVGALPAVSANANSRSVLDIVARPALLAVALTITLSYALHSATLYYTLNWIPKIVVDLSFSQSQAASVAAWCSGGGILGSLLAAWLATRLQIRALTMSGLLATAIFLCLFAHTPRDLTYLTVAALLLGACLYGAQVSLYALMTRSFPVHVRATGVGFVTGIGRSGGVISPLVSGYLLGIGLPYSQVSVLMALGSGLAAVALLLSYQPASRMRQQEIQAEQDKQPES
jgi:benzoate transport